MIANHTRARPLAVPPASSKTRRASWVCAALLLAALFVRTGAAADVSVNGDRLAITTANLSAQFRGPDLVRLNNRLTGEQYVSTQTSIRSMIDMTMLKPLGTPMKWTGWTQGKPPTGNPDAAMMSMTDLTRTVWITVVVDKETQDIVFTLWGQSYADGVTGLTWGMHGLDMTTGRLVLPAQGGRYADAATLPATLELEYPTHWEAQMVVWEGQRGGFVVYSRDEGMYFKTLRVTRRGGYADLGFTTQGEAPFPKSDGVPQVEWRINAFRGDWRVPATGYRALMRHFRPVPPLTDARKWTRDIRAVVSVVSREDDLALLDKLATRLDPPKTLLYLADWREARYDVNYPDYTARSGVRRYLERARELGFRVMLHTDLPGVSPGHPDYARLKRYQVKDATTGALQGWYWEKPETVPERFAFINPAARAWRETFIARLRPMVEELRPDAIHLDVSGPMWNDGNGPIEGKTYPQGSVELHKALLRAFPSVAFGGESMNELISPYNAFAQRWNFGTLPPHPISTFLFGDVVTSYGYLGLPNPDTSPDEHLSYLTLYEGQGVIPTLTVSSAADVEDGRRGAARVLEVARAWQKHDLQPDWSQPWEGAKFRWTGQNGAVAAVAATGPTVALTVGDQTMYTRARGVNRLVTRGHVAGWRAYSDGELLGLNPQAEYWLQPEPPPANEAHLSALPDNARVAASHVSSTFAMFRLEPVERTVERLLTHVPLARTGIVAAGKTEPLGKGATAVQSAGAAGGLQRAVLLAHPPWRENAVGDTFIEFDVQVPDRPAALLTEVGISDTATQSDGVAFQVTVDGDRLFDELVKPGGWKPARVSLNRYQGRRVRLRLITGPGPANNVSFDQAMWAEPRIVLAEAPAAAPAVLVTPPGVTAVATVGQGAGASVAAGRVDFGTVQPPCTLVALLTPGADVAAGTALLDLPHEMALVSGGVAREGSAWGSGGVGSVVAGGVERARALNAHPPPQGETVASWVVRLPDGAPLALHVGAGLVDNAATSGVGYAVRVNGVTAWAHSTSTCGWTEAVVDLSAHQGRTVLLQLVTDSLGEAVCDWARWDNPRLAPAGAAP